jgi:spermidine synthase
MSAFWEQYECLSLPLGRGPLHTVPMDPTRNLTLIVTLMMASVVMGAWELIITRVASMLFFYDLAYLVLAICLFALGIGAILSRRLVSVLPPWAILLGTLVSPLIIYPILTFHDAGWWLGLFAIPFFFFGGLSAIIWGLIKDLRLRTWLYSSELLGAILGILLIGPFLLNYIPVNVLGPVGVDNHLKSVVAREGLVRHQWTTDAYARTDFVETTRESVKYVFTDGMFLTRSVRWDGDSLSFTDPYVESLAKMKRLAIRISQPEAIVLLGAGAGFDIAVALSEAVSEIEAVEINPATIAFARQVDKWAGGILANQKVSVINAEARRFIQSSDKKWDQINLTLLQTSPAAMRAGTHVDARVLTVEAIDTYLDRLNSDGTIVVIQNRRSLAAATERVVIEVIATRVDKVVNKNSASDFHVGEAQKRILRYQLADATEQDNPFHYLIAVGKQPFSDEEVIRITRQASMLGAVAVQTFLSGTDVSSSFAPANDDRPFFFEPGMALALQSLLIVAMTLLALAMMLLRSGTPGSFPISLASLVAGMGAMMIQVVAVYWCQQAIGYPTLAMSVALSSVLAGGGFGVLIFGTMTRVLAWWTFGVLAALSMLIGLLIVGFVTGLAIGITSVQAAVMMFGFVFVVALPMGLPFIATMQQSAPVSEGESFVVGYDGFGGVIGASLASLMAIVAGFKMLGITIVLTFLAFSMICYWSRQGSDKL